MPSVLVIGDVMTDIIVRPEGSVAHGADRRAAVRQMPGGSGANQAAWLASEGVAVVFAGRVGAADRARQAELLAASGVRPALAADESQPTGTLVTLIAPDGERSFLTDRGANCNLGRADLPDALLDGVDLLHVSAYALFEPGPRAAVLGLMAEAQKRGVPVSVDPSSWSFLEEVGREAFLAWTRGAHFLFPNAREAAVLAGSGDRDRQLDVLGRAYPIVVLKRGTEAAYAFERQGGRRWSAPVPQVEAIDASGGGDAFLGGFLAAWLRGEAMEDCLKRGVTRGAAAVTRLGGRPPS